MQMQFAETSDSFLTRNFPRFSTQRPLRTIRRWIDFTAKSHFPAARVSELNRGVSAKVRIIEIPRN